MSNCHSPDRLSCPKCKPEGAVDRVRDYLDQRATMTGLDREEINVVAARGFDHEACLHTEDLEVLIALATPLLEGLPQAGWDRT